MEDRCKEVNRTSSHAGCQGFKMDQLKIWCTLPITYAVGQSYRPACCKDLHFQYDGWFTYFVIEQQIFQVFPLTLY